MSVKSAFRNLLNTQYKEGGRLVTKSYLTYEQVLKQIKRDFCDEELNILLAYLYSFKFPTREQQIMKEVKRVRRAKKILMEKKAKESKITIEDVIKANEKFIPKTGKPVLWNGADPNSVKDIKILRVKKE